MTVVYLIRHAEALSREEWSEQDKDRPLTERGRKQARNIAADLKKSGVSSRRMIEWFTASCATGRHFDLEVTAILAYQMHSI